jgi:hypothetical protein
LTHDVSAVPQAGFNDPTPQDASDTVVIDLATLMVTSPNGGEGWVCGSAQTITWDVDGLTGNAVIGLLRNGTIIGVIAKGIDVTSGSYAWTAGQYIGGTAPAGSDYKIGIRLQGTTIRDVSDALFTLSAPLTVTSPNGGENWVPCSTENITWEAPGVSGNLKIFLYRYRTKLGVIADNVSPGSGSYAWTVGQYDKGTAEAGRGYRIVIRDKGSTLYDASDAPFTISPVIKILSPNGGEQWEIYSRRDISWSANGVYNLLRITLWKDGELIGTIANNVNPEDRRFSWIVGRYANGIVGMAPVGTGYTIKIKAIGATISDSSDNSFEIICNTVLSRLGLIKCN